jgi:uncharacterized protein YcbK (DUF882 family)
MGAAILATCPRIASHAHAAGRRSGQLSLYNIHTGQRVRARYLRGDGHHDPEGLATLSEALRCHATGRVTSMDARVLEFVGQVNHALGDRLVHVISGYRSPEYNARLVRQGRGVAPDSLHLSGRAIDLRIPGVPLAQVRQVALRLRLGGVGYYPDSDFVHLDSGPFRVW